LWLTKVAITSSCHKVDHIVAKYYLDIYASLLFEIDHIVAKYYLDIYASLFYRN